MGGLVFVSFLVYLFCGLIVSIRLSTSSVFTHQLHLGGCLLWFVGLVVMLAVVGDLWRCF